MELIILDLGKFVVVAFAIVYVWNMCTKKDDSWHSRRLKLLEEQEKHRMRLLEMKYKQQLQQKHNCCTPQSSAGFFTVACAFIVGVILGG